MSACPCGAGGTFGECCGPLLDGAPAPTAEALMRSRYTAFALRDAGHLAATWHLSTRPADLTLEDAPRWERLEILGTEAGRPTDTRGTVEFRAHWVHDRGGRGILHEVSRFVFQRERWWYLDGEVDAR
ncbi:SEC-C motif-containing protein [Microbacterium saccharophilum]|uniref:SEC-C motif-containing protein n=2 Tax=Microbacteriaceae TaxID=85023 RepID=A0A7Z7GEN2_9MICO|nr:SEC-C motif-containing protein [Microbacterium saccharophilum]